MQPTLQAGLFDVTLSLGDEALEEAVQWQLGSVNVTHAPGGSGASALSAAARDSLPKPEIRHVFRTPDKRPPVALSLFFAAATVALPSAFLLLRLYQLGVSLKVRGCRWLHMHAACQHLCIARKELVSSHYTGRGGRAFPRQEWPRLRRSLSMPASPASWGCMLCSGCD